MAMQVVGSQSFKYIKFKSRETNSIGIDESVYESPRYITGQVQAVPHELFEKYGLDFTKSYLMFYVSKDILDIQRGVSGDRFEFENNTYQAEKETDWRAINGWTAVLSVKV